MDDLLRFALRAGIGVQEFWALTPRETAMAIEASWWRWEQEQKRSAWQAWTTAALSRAKRLPSLDSMMNVRREFTPEDLAKRKARHAELAAAVNQPEMQDKLKQFMEQRGHGRRQRKAGNRQRTDSSGAERAR